jgi:Amt family ammonium transporter
MENQIFELQYAIDTFYFLICGALVMWMAAGFAMLESGLVRAKNTNEILTKNISLFAIACTMYMICGYDFMYGGGWFLSGVETTGGIDVAAALAASAERLRRRLCVLRCIRLLLPGGVRGNGHVHCLGCNG